ncbi:hypothetical protein [Massilia sp. erpn]|uniref:hypothetical protein n=1 Tax=Massilia sp. erpn TaxID=2738142 RepID=UPI0021026D20|nr:hypothetical protein [Massilia sp. erpn]UTY59323.1 hypothetical protein HPQ68_20365 [Massilia sp. erpn]
MPVEAVLDVGGHAKDLIAMALACMAPDVPIKMLPTVMTPTSAVKVTAMLPPMVAPQV